MIRYLLLVLIIIIGGLASMYFFIGVPRIYTEPLPEFSVPHFYKKPDQPLGSIKIFAFYFVPKNKVDTAIENWKEILEENLKKLQEFHRLQFQGRSKIVYDIYHEPIIGLKNNLDYDTETTQYGNPEGLRRVTAEIETRIFDSRGDLFREEFVRGSGVDYRSLVILYEGVGASGSDNVAFVSRIFLSDPRYRAVSASTLSHEFYHTLGVPDAYEGEKAIPTSQDLMGLGRERPIERAYLDKETLRSLGL